MNNKTVTLLVFVFSLLFFLVGASFFYQSRRFDRIESQIGTLSSVKTNFQENDKTVPEISTVDNCGSVCKQTINDLLSKAISTISSKTKVTESTKVVSKNIGTSYIPMGTTYSTTSTDWYTLDDTAAYIDIASDYGTNVKVSWEVSLKVAHGNGQAYARLWDDTNKIAVNGSELTAINNPAYLLVSSGNLSFWSGRNLYKLQIKSLNSFEVTLTGGKIKITY